MTKKLGENLREQLFEVFEGVSTGGMYDEEGNRLESAITFSEFLDAIDEFDDSLFTQIAEHRDFIVIKCKASDGYAVKQKSDGRIFIEHEDGRAVEVEFLMQKKTVI